MSCFGDGIGAIVLLRLSEEVFKPVELCWYTSKGCFVRQIDGSGADAVKWANLFSPREGKHAKAFALDETMVYKACTVIDQHSEGYVVTFGTNDQHKIPMDAESGKFKFPSLVMIDTSNPMTPIAPAKGSNTNLDTLVSFHPDEIPTLIEKKRDPLPTDQGFLSGLSAGTRWDASQELTTKGLTAAPFVVKW